MRRPSNPLALAVLALLYEKPMHPYEMSSTLRFRQKEDSIKINYGSLYAVVESLAKRGSIDAVERVRDGRRPERTVYALTAPGEELLHSWLSELLAHPTRQYTDFEAAMSLLPVLAPEVVRDLLEQRLKALAAEADQYVQSRAEGAHMPAIFFVEGEYRAALRDAEIAFVRALVEQIATGTLGGLDVWRRVQEIKRSGGQHDLVGELQKEFDPDHAWGPDSE